MKNTVQIKAITSETATIAGYGVIFGGVDLEGDTFTKDTNYHLSMVPVKPVFFDHTMDEVIKSATLGTIASVANDGIGLWIEAQIERSNQYAEAVLELIEAGKLGWSSGSVGHLVRRDENKTITNWPIVEWSLTPTPAEPRTVGIERLKAVIADFEQVESLEMDTIKSEEKQDESKTDNFTNIQIITNEENEMSENENRDNVVTVEQFDALSAKITRVLASLESDVKARGVTVAPDSTDDHAEVKSFGDWLIALRNRNTKRLVNVYGSTKAALNEGTGAEGGYLVPEDYRAELLSAMMEGAIMLPRARRISTNRDRVVFPVLDQTGTASGESNFLGGLNVEWTAEAATKTESEPTFKNLTLTPHKLAAYTLASDELLADSAIALEQLLMSLFGQSIGWKADYAMLQGDGVGKPLGVTNAGATKSVTRAAGGNDFEYADAIAMYEGMLSSSRGNAIWVMNQTLMSDVMELGDGTNNIFVTNAAAEMPMTLFGRPIFFTEKLPAAGSAGDCLFVDPSQYLVAENGGIVIDSSIHYKFVNDQTTWRGVYRVDGSPWLSAPITLADGTTTVSPFVLLT